MKPRNLTITLLFGTFVTLAPSKHSGAQCLAYGHRPLTGGDAHTAAVNVVLCQMRRTTAQPEHAVLGFRVNADGSI
ncbi:hypothetical protein B0T10DRAFT_488965 [Thelonectria olida]|uniref:Secreted protein n=1 Tax=Thelonectria olida TaxID=1576542 RepID=A0A9P8W2P5_9HYPO|nr:hypothetical protein B0T10DRAFT_488965 [Thelonectria olida]